MSTVTVLIGNSDDKLPQREWASFCRVVTIAVEAHSKAVHFSGYSGGDMAWQNACWVAEFHDWQMASFREWLGTAADRYRQESIAILVGETEFVKPMSLGKLIEEMTKEGD